MIKLQKTDSAAVPSDGFFRTAAATPVIRVANCEENAQAVYQQIAACAEHNVGAVVFPELALTGYTCGDLFHDCTLQKAAENALAWLLKKTASLPILFAVGVPVLHGASLYNCAAVCCGGRLLGLSAKRFLPNYSEFYEQRWFTPAPQTPLSVSFAGQETTLGSGLLYTCHELPELVIGVEICEDLWVPAPPSIAMAQAGATVIFNASASDEVISKAEYRQDLVRGQSARLYCTYVYADAGEGESTTDLVFAAHNLIAEGGSVLSSSPLFQTGILTADTDLERLLQERRRTTTWQDVPAPAETVIPFSFDYAFDRQHLQRRFPRTPFVPESTKDLAERCDRILSLQANGLKTRLKHTGIRSAVIGISGGLDSTLALLVTVRAFDLLGLPRSGITAISMPGFGTTGRTKSNAEGLSRALGVAFREIPIGAAVHQHFADIGHDEAVQDITYENSQARERTQILMDISNQSGGLVIGTGDLSELALGWATYNGDHMSMYGVNASIPKTLVRHLVRYAAQAFGGEISRILLDVLDTPVSPELLPPKDGKIAQKTEEVVGPYELHDYFLYYMLRFGFSPAKIYRMAADTFAGIYSPSEIFRWLKKFYQRFFHQQFKRSCLPDSPKVGTITLSPRGDWRMPSDASVHLWMKELDKLADTLSL
ncbi:MULTISPECIES: NAD(+) synthase [Caproicibacterium]|jgi:NAD+ synthase (glutamine-hydrolysing)|uniref:Glutamine-dependent NAD(+) synthetase n=1 Tax=Caproicibacterium lactatifermentans TaxID=2666138 RepID=A0A859DNZ1_9FIRM|nr:NAD(+) synthase [Caproicibacterium lactatifermentans]ARP51029.1 NAD(+) synthase [Ruminococcaceae bacterium CPB6]MDD4807167.1 NAD(+) synthase [Oscillospiraceae bacterium]QKN23244.1 NAD(+) synthase [Caproicibacterium lactatifermentans]QKO30074.1 NAD(+) synthase [Caproicibacterium lactatifermentans]